MRLNIVKVTLIVFILVIAPTVLFDKILFLHLTILIIMSSLFTLCYLYETPKNKYRIIKIEYKSGRINYRVDKRSYHFFWRPHKESKRGHIASTLFIVYLTTEQEAKNLIDNLIHFDMVMNEEKENKIIMNTEAKFYP